MLPRFISGLANCHVKGLYSLVISDRVNDDIGMKRVFYCSIGCDMSLWSGAWLTKDGYDFRIKPHNHKQDVRLKRFFGDVENVMLKPTDGEHHLTVYEYAFCSALLNGKFELARVMTPSKVLRTSAPLEQLDMRWDEVHTVVAKPHSAWLVEEGKLAPPNMQRLWSTQPDLKLSEEGLYVPLARKELAVFDEMFQECDL